MLNGLQHEIMLGENWSFSDVHFFLQSTHIFRPGTSLTKLDSLCDRFKDIRLLSPMNKRNDIILCLKAMMTEKTNFLLSVQVHEVQMGYNIFCNACQKLCS